MLDFSHTHSPEHLKRSIEWVANDDPSGFDLSGFPLADVWTYPPDWTAGQVIRPMKLRRLPDWQVRLERCFDDWSMKRYDSGTICCFTFVCACIDAMCGSNLSEVHSGGWRGAGNVWSYLTPRGGRAFFDRYGTRIPTGEAQPGDLFQMETIHGDRVHLHWAIATGAPSQGVAFDVGGVTAVNTFNSVVGYQGRVFAWRIG